MLLDCPGCQASVRLDGSRRGVTLRCPACGTTFRVQAPRTTAPAVFWSLAAAALALVVLVVVLRSSREQAVAREPGPSAAGAASAAPPDPSSTTPGASLGGPTPVSAAASDPWSSAPVQAAVALHEAAFAGDRAALLGLLSQRALAEQGDTPALASERLVSSSEPFAPRSWRPFDGELVERDDSHALVRLACAPRDGQGLAPEERFAERWIEWQLVRDPGDARWRASRWSRWISPEEERAERPRNEAVVLSDGSRVVERELEHLEHLPDTPPELRSRIEALIATMIDLDLTRESEAARAELVAIGRPAIPALLNGLSDAPIVTQDDAIRANLLVQSLRKITGRSFGFRPQLLEGSSLGTTEERRTSAIRQWFAWWSMNQDTFQERPTEASAGAEEDG